MTGFGGLDERPDVIEAQARRDTTASRPEGRRDEAVDRLARLLAGIYGRGRGWDGILTAERTAYRNDARAIARYLASNPEDTAAMLDGKVGYAVRGTDGQVWASKVEDDDVRVARVVGPWREVTSS